MFNGLFATPFIIPVVAIIAWAVVAVVKAKHGIPDAEWDEEGKPMHRPPMFRKMFEKEIAERDDEIRKLKERVLVLEKIVTETHSRHSLSEEIDNLRDKL